MHGFARRAAAATATVVVTLSVFGLTSVGATTHAPLGTKGAHARAVARPAGRGGVSTTDEGAGYWLYPENAHGLASVSATFTVPAITCQNGSDQEWLLPGIWVFSEGEYTEQVDVNLNCNDGSTFEAGFACLTDGCSDSIAIAPDDVVKVSLAYTPTATIGTVKDVTQHTTAQFVGAANTTDEVVLVGDLAPDWFFGGIVTRVPTFTSVAFSSVQINAQDLADGPFPTRYNLQTAGRVQITTGPITRGTNFKTTFAHN